MRPQVHNTYKAKAEKKNNQNLIYLPKAVKYNGEIEKN